MATPSAPAETAQQGQEAIAALALPLLRDAWALFDPADFAASLERFRTAVQAVVQFYGRAAAAAALERFRAARAEAGMPGRAPSVPPPTVPEGFIDQLVTEVVAQSFTDEAKALDRLDSGAEQLVLEQARRQMMSAARLDSEAVGWTRVPNAGACSFCLMLAIRGPVYKSQRSAGFSAHTKQPDGSGGDCRCTAEPVFGHWEPTARVRAAQAVWVSSTRGRSGHDAQVAFRQAVEGREVTGAPSSSSSSKSSGKKRHYAAPSGVTPENQRAQLRILEALPPAKTPAAAKWRAGRVAEIRKYLGE